MLSYCYLLEGQLIEAESHIRTAIDFAQSINLFSEELSSKYTLALVLFYQDL